MIEIDIDNISVIMMRIAVLTQQLASIETFIHNFLYSFLSFVFHELFILMNDHKHFKQRILPWCFC